MHPKILENFLFLRENKAYWAPGEVEEVKHYVGKIFDEMILSDDGEVPGENDDEQDDDNEEEYI